MATVKVASTKTRTAIRADKFTTGADVEAFLRRGRAMVSSIGVIDGSKYEPVKMECGSVLSRDNVAAEFAIPICHNKIEFVDAIRAAYSELAQMLSPKGLTLHLAAAERFPEKSLEHPEAQKIGCEPDYNAWSMTINTPPSLKGIRFRSCGAHVHVGHVAGGPYKFLLEEMGKVRFVRCFELFGGMLSVACDHSNKSIMRHALYGKAGCHRPTDYGVEYRVPSPAWTALPQGPEGMYEAVHLTLECVERGWDKTLLSKVGGRAEVESIINNSLADRARLVINTIHDMVDKIDVPHNSWWACTHAQAEE